MTVDWYQMPYNYSNGTSIEGLGNFFQYLSLITNNWLGNGIILIIWLMSFGLSLMAGSRKALMVSSFISLAFAVYLFRLNMIHFSIMAYLVIGVIIGILGSWHESSSI